MTRGAPARWLCVAACAAFVACGAESETAPSAPPPPTNVPEAMAEKTMADAGAERTHDRHQCQPDGLGAGGFDLVSYHDAAGPVAGAAEITSTVDGVTYRFASEANRDAFDADPQRYLPSYGGFCATSLALGRTTCPDPLNFRIENGRLLLFEVTGFTNGRTLWESRPGDYRQRADANFLDFFGR